MMEANIPVHGMLLARRGNPGAECNPGARRSFAPGAVGTGRAIDNAELDSVRSFMTKEGFAAFLGQCLEQIAKHIEDLERPAADPARRTALAHGMIGSAGVIGAAGIVAIARELETASAANNGLAVADMTAQLIAAWAEARLELELLREFALIR